MRKVEVVSHQKEWSRLFQEESSKLTKIYGNEVYKIYHIGSTSIPNIHAKPIIDIMVEVNSIERVDSYNKHMEQLGYEAMRENGIANRRFFIKGGNDRTHHVHIFEKGNDEIVRHLAFRDYLIANPVEALEYSQLKQKLAERFPTDIDKYIEGKNDFIKEIDRRAKEWMERSKKLTKYPYFSIIVIH